MEIAPIRNLVHPRVNAMGECAGRDGGDVVPRIQQWTSLTTTASWRTQENEEGRQFSRRRSAAAEGKERVRNLMVGAGQVGSGREGQQRGRVF